MQLIAALIFIGLLLAIGGACLYFGSHQSQRYEHYGSWSRMLPPLLNGSPLDVNEKLNKEISAGRRQARQTRHVRRPRDKKK